MARKKESILHFTIIRCQFYQFHIIFHASSENDAVGMGEHFNEMSECHATHSISHSNLKCELLCKLNGLSSFMDQ